MHDPIDTDLRLHGDHKNANRRGVPNGCDELMTIAQVMETSKFGRTFVDAAISSGTLKAAKLGRVWRIRVSAFNEWVDVLEQAEAA